MERIEARDLACRRSGRLIFSDLSFSLGAGEGLMVTGRNGAGKSTLLALLAGRLRPEAGTISAKGIGEAEIAERLHWVGHRDALKSALTAEENLAFAQALLGEPRLPPRDALDAVGLAHAAPLPVAYLSAGQRRRVALARLLVARRPLWLLDEPGAALDSGSQEMLREMMAAHLAGGGLVIAATHQELGIEGAREVRIAPPFAPEREGDEAVKAAMRSPPPRGAGLGVGGGAEGTAMPSRHDQSGADNAGSPPPAPTPTPNPSPQGGGERVEPFPSHPLPTLADARATLSLGGRGKKHGGPRRPLSLPASGRLSLPLQGGGMFAALIARDLRLAARIGGSGALGLVFFLMIVTLVPFALGPDLRLLARIGAAVLWLAAVLSTLIGLDRLFQADEEDGSLDLLHAAPVPLELAVLAKAIAHWLTTGLPLAVASPLFGLLVALTPEGMAAVAVTLLVGTPALTFIGAIGAALTASLRRGGLILAILVLPLMIPTLIFGVSAAEAALGGTVPFHTPFLILTALSLLAGVVGTVAAAAALRWAE